MGKAVIISEQGEGRYTIKKEVRGLASAQALAADRRERLEAELPAMRLKEEEAVNAVVFQRFVTDTLLNDWLAGIEIPEDTLNFELRYGITDEARQYVQAQATGLEVPAALMNAIHELVEKRMLLDDIRRQLDEKSAEYLAVLKWQGELTALGNLADTPIPAWCADYTEKLAGTVATLEVPGEVDPLIGGGINIRPGFSGANWPSKHQDIDADPADPPDNPLWFEFAKRYGQIQAGKTLSPAGFAWNFTMLQPWMKWLPKWRYATITAINQGTGRVDLNLNPILSKAGAYLRKDLTLNGFIAPYMDDVKVDYMNCDAAAFDVGDEIVVEFQEIPNDEGKIVLTPVVIGFKENPVNCSTTAFIFYPRTLDFPAGIYNAGGGDAKIIGENVFSYLFASSKESENFFKVKAPEPAAYGNQFFFFKNDVFSWWHSSNGDGPIVSSPFYNFGAARIRDIGHYTVFAAIRDPFLFPKFWFILPDTTLYEFPRTIYRRNSPFYNLTDPYTIISGFWIGSYENENLPSLSNLNQRCLIAVTYLHPSIYTEVRAFRIDQNNLFENVFTEISEQNPFRLYPFQEDEIWNFRATAFQPAFVGSHGFWPVRFNHQGTQCASLYCSSTTGAYNENDRDFVETVVVDIAHDSTSVIFSHSTRDRVTNIRGVETNERQDYSAGENFSYESTLTGFDGTDYDIRWPMALDYDKNAALVYAFFEMVGKVGLITDHSCSVSRSDNCELVLFEDECGTDPDGQPIYTISTNGSFEFEGDYRYYRSGEVNYSVRLIFPSSEKLVDVVDNYFLEDREGQRSQSGETDLLFCGGTYVSGSDEKTECVSRASLKLEKIQPTTSRYLVNIRYIRVKNEVVFYSYTKNTFVNYVRDGDYDVCDSMNYQCRNLLDVYPGSYQTHERTDNEKRLVFAAYEGDSVIFDWQDYLYEEGSSETITTVPIDNIDAEYPGWAVYDPGPSGSSYNNESRLEVPEYANDFLRMFSGYDRNGFNISVSFVVDDRDFGFSGAPWAASYQISNLHSTLHSSVGTWFQAGTQSAFGPLNSKIFYLDEEGNLDLDAPVEFGEGEVDSLTVYPIGLQ